MSLSDQRRIKILIQIHNNTPGGTVISDNHFHNQFTDAFYSVHSFRVVENPLYAGDEDEESYEYKLENFDLK